MRGHARIGQRRAARCRAAMTCTGCSSRGASASSTVESTGFPRSGQASRSARRSTSRACTDARRSRSGPASSLSSTPSAPWCPRAVQALDVDRRRPRRASPLRGNPVRLDRCRRVRTRHRAARARIAAPPEPRPARRCGRVRVRPGLRQRLAARRGALRDYLRVALSLLGRVGAAGSAPAPGAGVPGALTIFSVGSLVLACSPARRPSPRASRPDVSRDARRCAPARFGGGEATDRAHSRFAASGMYYVCRVGGTHASCTGTSGHRRPRRARRRLRRRRASATDRPGPGRS